MTFAAWIELITLALKFPSSLLALAKFLEKTPAEKHQELIGQVQTWMEQSAAADRPTWEHP